MKLVKLNMAKFNECSRLRQYLKRIHEAQEGQGASSGSAEARARALAQDERQCRSYLTLAR